MEPVFPRAHFACDMKCVAYLLTALVVMWAASGHAQTIFPISENDVDVSGTVLMCPKSDIYAPSRGSTYAPCSGAGTLTHSVKVGGTPKLFAQVITPYREGYEQHHRRHVHHRVPYRAGYEQRHHRHICHRVAVTWQSGSS